MCVCAREKKKLLWYTPAHVEEIHPEEKGTLMIPACGRVDPKIRKGIMVGKQKGVKSFNWEHRGRRKSRSREKKQEKYKIHPEWAPEIKPKHRNSLPNRRQQNPRGRREAPPPCCLPFGKDFLCFGIISGARSGSIFDKICRFWYLSSPRNL